jgi:hypothetical protein
LAVAALTGIALARGDVSRGQHLFLTGPSGGVQSAALLRVNPDGTGLTTWFESPDAIRGIAVDELHQHVFWITSSASGTTNVRRAQLDGGQPHTVFSESTSVPREAAGLAVDPAQGFIYWGESTGLIRRANLDGSQLVDLLAGLGTNGGGPFDIELDPAGGKIYWSEGVASPRIRRANVDASGIENFRFSDGGPFRGLAFDATTRGLYAAYDLGGDTSQIGGPATQIISPFRVDGLALDEVGRTLYWAGTGGVNRAAIGADQTEAIIVGPGHLGPLAYTAIAEPPSICLSAVSLAVLVLYLRARLFKLAQSAPRRSRRAARRAMFVSAYGRRGPARPDRGIAEFR